MTSHAVRSSAPKRPTPLPLLPAPFAKSRMCEKQHFHSIATCSLLIKKFDLRFNEILQNMYLS